MLLNHHVCLYVTLVWYNMRREMRETNGKGQVNEAKYHA